MQKRLTITLGVLGCILAFLGYALCADPSTAEQGLRVWIARTLTETVIATVVGGIFGMAIGYYLAGDSNGFADALRSQSLGRRRRRSKRPRSVPTAPHEGKKQHS